MATAQAAGYSSYEEACADHRWHVPERYNIARDVCDKHPRDKLAMIWEDWRGNERRGRLGRAPGPLQPGGERARARTAWSAATASRCVLPPTPETAAIFLGTWKLGAILLSMSVLYGDEGIAPPPERLGAEGARHRR